MIEGEAAGGHGGIWLDLAVKVEGRPVLVVGGGHVAVRRIERLEAAAAQVTVVAPTLEPRSDGTRIEPTEPQESAPAPTVSDSTSIRWFRREYRRGDTNGMWLVVAATGRFDVDSAVVADATAAGILVNDVSNADAGDVVFPAVSTHGALTATFRSSGASPALSSWIRRRFDAQWTGIDELVKLMGQAREMMRAAGRPTTHTGWEQALDDGLLDLVRNGQFEAARSLLYDRLDLGPGRPLSD